MRDRFMINDYNRIMFMVEPGVWVQFDGYDIIDGEVYLYYKGHNAAVLRGLDYKDFVTHTDECDEYMNEGREWVE